MQTQVRVRVGVGEGDLPNLVISHKMFFHMWEVNVYTKATYLPPYEHEDQTAHSQFLFPLEKDLSPVVPQGEDLWIWTQD